MRERVREKKGIEPIVATVALIGVSIALFVIVFIWSRSFVQEQVLKFGEDIEKECENVKLSVNNVLIRNNNVTFDLDNRGNVNIYKIGVEYYYEGGKISREYDASPAGALPAGRAAIFTQQEDLQGKTIKKVVVYPILLGEGKESKEQKSFLCEAKKEEISFS